MIELWSVSCGGRPCVTKPSRLVREAIDAFVGVYNPTLIRSSGSCIKFHYDHVTLAQLGTSRINCASPHRGPTSHLLPSTFLT